MRICVIPLKPLADAKARLAPTLQPDERRILSLAMLTDVIAAARGFDRVWVLNSDADAAIAAERAGAEPRPDPAPGRGLNASLDASTFDAVRVGASGVLVVSADVPAVTLEDLAALADGDGVALAADDAGTGTNALWRSPGGAIAAAFGPDSRVAHEAAAAEAGVPFRVVSSARLAADVDTPDGLATVWGLGPGPATREVMERMGLPVRLRPAG